MTIRRLPKDCHQNPPFGLVPCCRAQKRLQTYPASIVGKPQWWIFFGCFIQGHGKKRRICHICQWWMPFWPPQILRVWNKISEPPSNKIVVTISTLQGTAGPLHRLFPTNSQDIRCLSSMFLTQHDAHLMPLSHCIWFVHHSSVRW